MAADRDLLVLDRVLRAAEMYRRELRMRNKVELFKAILEADQDEMGWLEMADTVNNVYAELYVLRKPSHGVGHG